MFFLNLSLGEFLAILTGVTGIVTALYLLDRAKKKNVVASLRFWVGAPRVDEHQHRKRIREPWSLLLQLAGIALLLLAIAQLQLGSRERSGRAHVILLDTSSSSAQTSGKLTLLEIAKRRARQFIERLPVHDRVMLVRAGGIATPATGFIENREQLARAINASTSSYAALNLAAALTLASHALRWTDSPPGEVVFVGSSRVANWDDEHATAPGLRVIDIREPEDNIGIRRLAVTRDSRTDNQWIATVAVHNYSQAATTVHVALQFAASRFSPRILKLRPGEEQTAQYQFSTTGAGTLTASIDSRDSLALDNRVEVRLPREMRARVAVFTDRPSAWQALLDTDNELQVSLFPASRYVRAPDVDLVILDRVTPQSRPSLPSLWIMPERSHSPVPVLADVSDGLLSHWNTEAQLGAGLRSRDLRLGETRVFEPAAGDIPIAFAVQGPIVVARSLPAPSRRFAVVGFDPLRGSLRYEVATPLLFVNLIRWLMPESAKVTEITAAPVGSASINLDPEESRQHFQVVDGQGFQVPFTVRSGLLQLYAVKPSIIRIVSPVRERILSLTLPGFGELHWKPPADATRSIPRIGSFGRDALDVWKLLAVLGALGLLAEWFFFGRERPLRWHPVKPLRQSSTAHEREVVRDR